MAFRMEGTTGPAEIAYCQEPGRTGPGLPGQDVAAAGLRGPDIPCSHTPPPTSGPGCFAPQVITLGSPGGRGGGSLGLTSTVLVKKLVPLSGFRKLWLGHQPQTQVLIWAAVTNMLIYDYFIWLQIKLMNLKSVSKRKDNHLQPNM